MSNLRNDYVALSILGVKGPSSLVSCSSHVKEALRELGSGGRTMGDARHPPHGCLLCGLSPALIFDVKAYLAAALVADKRTNVGEDDPDR